MIDKVFFEGVELTIDPEAEIRPGDTYLAGKDLKKPNRLLTCKRHEISGGFIVPVEDAYLFDTWQCVKVIGGLD